MVDQEFEGKALIFTRDMRVQLDVREQPERRITFRDLALSDFEVYRGSWPHPEDARGSEPSTTFGPSPRAAPPPPSPGARSRMPRSGCLPSFEREMVRRAAQLFHPHKSQRKARHHEE